MKRRASATDGDLDPGPNDSIRIIHADKHEGPPFYIENEYKRSRVSPSSSVDVSLRYKGQLFILNIFIKGSDNEVEFLLLGFNEVSGSGQPTSLITSQVALLWHKLIYD